MKRVISIFFVLVCCIASLSGCAKKQTGPGKVHTGKIDYDAFSIQYEGKEYSIFARLGPDEEQLKGEWIGSAMPDGTVQKGEKANPKEGTYDVYQCVRDEQTYVMVGLDFSLVLFFEYNTGGEEEGFGYWMVPPEFNPLEEESITSFDEYLKEAVSNEEAGYTTAPVED